MRVVVDTNVFVSRLLSPKGPPARVFGLWEEHVFELVVSSAILDEYRRALSYERVSRRHGLSPAEVEDLIEATGNLTIVVEPTLVLTVIDQDQDDNKFLECAIAGEAEYIVSGDRHLLDLGRYEGIEILSPAAFLAVIRTG